MAMNNELRYLQKQEQRISTSLIQGLNMLSLPTQAIYNYLVELSMGNPMLEIPEPPTPDRYESILGYEQSLTYLDRGRDPVYGAGVGSGADRGEEHDPYYSKGAAFEADALAGQLKLQLSMCRLKPVEQAIGEEIIGNIDDSGYFIGNLDTICLLYRQPPEVGRRVLSVIQGFQPRGIAAEDVYEALCLQVDDAFEYAQLAKCIIQEDLQAICGGGATVCARKYKVSEACICQVFDYIRSLEPRPGNCDECQFEVSYILPDIIVKKSNDGLDVYLSGDADIPLHLCAEYLKLLQQPGLGQEERRYMRTCLNEARSLIHSVDIRRQTLHRFALSLVRAQGDFFRFGPEHLQPLTMQQLSAEMGVNVSTVSRTVQDKYISTPWGLFPLKYFFVRALKGTDEGAVSATAAKQRIEQLIRAEEPAAPLTDEQICQALEGEGCCVSRRTVTKYRQAAGIPGYAKRRYKRR